MRICETLGEDLHGICAKICKTLESFMEICETLGEDSWGFARICETLGEDLQ